MRPVILLALFAALAVTPAAAQTFRQITVTELRANPDRYLKQRLELREVYCHMLEDNGGYECGTSEPLTIRSKAMADGPLKTKIEAECGGLDAIEHNPNCRSNLRFVPTEVSKEEGEVMVGGQLTKVEITVITADTVTPVAAR